MKRVLVIGASGFVGRHVDALARDSGYLTVGTQARAGRPDLVRFDLAADRLGDSVPSDFWGTSGDGVGILCASMSQIDRCFRERETSRRVNVERTLQAVEDLRARGVRPVYLSSSFVYDGREGYYSEDHPHSPISEYGRQKSEVERWIVSNVPEALVVRLDKVVGDEPGEKHLFSEWTQAVEAGQPVVCIRDQLFSPTLVDDLARAILLACERGLTGLYNLCAPEYFTRDELARQFLRRWGREAEIVCRSQEEIGFVDPRPEKSYLDAAKFRRATGMAFTSMREAMENYLERRGRDGKK